MSQLLWDLAKTAFGKPNEIQLDTQILRLHSRISFRVFLICSLMLTIRQIIGTEDIMCYDHGQTKDDTLNAHCWIHSTYSVRELFYVCSDGDRNCKIKYIYPGVGQKESDSTTYSHTYYQWTSIVLCINAFISYIPRFLWKSFENGLQRTLSYDRRLVFYPMIPNDDDGEGNHKQHLQNVVSYFKTHRGQHQSYFYKYCFCEFLGLMCTIVNFVLTDLLLRFQFSNFGSEVVRHWWFDSKSMKTVSPMIKVFPLMAKCDWKRYGPSGNVVPKDPVCVLPLNALNDKIYLFLWFYLKFVFFVSALAILYRLCTIFFKKFRFILLKQKCGQLKEKILEDLCNRSHVGDWFVMYMFNKNVSGIFFQEFLEIYWEELLNRKLSV